MFPLLAKAVDLRMPRFNEALVEGFHKQEFEQGLQYYNHILKLIYRSVESKGVFFKGAKRVSPKDYMEYLGRSTVRTYDIHKETLYPVRLEFEFVDKEGVATLCSTPYTMLPYCDEYGDMYLRGVHYSLQLVLAERGIPVTKEDSLFVKVLGFKFKIGVERFKLDKVITELDNFQTRTLDVNLAANRFYRPTPARSITDTKTPIPLLAWYVFADMGFDNAMEAYGGVEYRIGHVDTLVAECKPEDRWEVFTRSSTLNIKFLGERISSDLGVAIRNKEKGRSELDVVGMQYTCALLYVIDCLSSYFEIERINDPDYWKLLIGRTSVKSGDTDDYIMRLMLEHFDSINEYLDEDSVRRFAGQSINVENMFDLFNYIIANRSEIVQTTDRATMFHKELASLEFTLDGLITAANRFKHDVKNNSELSLSKINRMIHRNFRIKEIDNARNTNLIQEATPTDNPFTDYMMGCMPQHRVYTNAGPNRRKAEFDPNDPASFIHASIPFVNSFQRVSQPYPDGRGYLNPCIHLSNGRITTLSPKHRELYKKTEKRLTQREVRK